MSFIDEIIKDKLKKAEEILKNVLPAEYNNLQNMSETEKNEYLAGFVNCIDEYKQAHDQNNGMGGGGGGQPQDMEDDGLSHWRPINNQNNSDGSGGRDNRKYIDDEQENELNKKSQQSQQSGQSTSTTVNQAQKEIDKSNDALSDFNNDGSPENAQNAADKAQKAANAAQAAANSAQKAANAAQVAAQAASNLADKAEADMNNSGNPTEAQKQAAQSAKESAAQAQEMADKAQASAQAAQAAANRAQSAASDAQAAANKMKNGNSEAADDVSSAAEAVNAAAQEAIDAARETGKNANDVGKALDDVKDLSNKANSNKNNSANNSNNSKYGDPNGDLGEVDLGDISDRRFGDGGDFYPGDIPNIHDYAKKIAEEAGQPYGPEDMEDPAKVADDLFKKAQESIKNTKPNKGRGFGNSISTVADTITTLFKSEINWKSKLKKMFDSVAFNTTRDIMAKRRMGVDDTNLLYKGRYQKPNEEPEEDLGGICQVFFLIDNSGSMGFGGNGDDIPALKHLFSEIIDLERKCDIKKSAIAYFGAGEIDKKQIRTWTHKETGNKRKLLEKIIRKPGDAEGGTSIATALNSIINMHDKKIFSKSEPRTLLIFVTDGGDDFSSFNSLMGNNVNRAVAIILSDKQTCETTKDVLIKQKMYERNIICIDRSKWDGCA